MSTLPSFAQDAFAGSDNGNAPNLEGATNGTIGSNFGTRQYSSEDLKKVTASLAQMEEALKNGDLDRYASLAYKVNSLTGLEEYKLLADVAMNDLDFEDVDGTLLLDHLDELKRILFLLGKTSQYIDNVLVKIGGRTSDVKFELSREKIENASIPTKDLQQLAKSGLRKFTGKELRVSWDLHDEKQSEMIKNCVKRTLAEICTSTRGALSVKYVNGNDSNFVIGCERKESLWYSYQSHTTATLTEPNQGAEIKSIRMKVPMLATLHRRISEAECQEWCNSEIVKALGYDWAPVGRERLMHDFPELAANQKGLKAMRIYSAELEAMTPSEHQRACFRQALTTEKEGGFAFYAGWVYLDKGNYQMARRYFCNATSYLINDPAALHALMTRLQNAGQANSAELIAFACINDDIDNDELSRATIEYNRVKAQAVNDARALPPTISSGDLKMINRIYAPPSTVPAERISSKDN